tara:strand:- start:82 stop:324 length:243 start_codon:yes stop_codon:yes gene_type:complete
MPGLIIRVELGFDDTEEEKGMYSATDGVLAAVDGEESRLVASGGRERMLKFRKRLSSHSALTFPISYLCLKLQNRRLYIP